MANTDDSATLRYPGGEIDLEVVHATDGNDGIALGSLLAKTGYTTFDNGFVGVWLPRDIDASVRITHDGRTATRTVRTGAQDATCLTTVKLA